MKIKFRKSSVVVLLVIALLAFWFLSKKSGFTPSPSPDNKKSTFGKPCGFLNNKDPKKFTRCIKSYCSVQKTAGKGRGTCGKKPQPSPKQK